MCVCVCLCVHAYNDIKWVWLVIPYEGSTVLCLCPPNSCMSILIQVFLIGEKDGSLYHVWQSERDASWSDWEVLGPLTSSSPFVSQPTILFDIHGWWQAFGVGRLV